MNKNIKKFIASLLVFSLSLNFILFDTYAVKKDDEKSYGEVLKMIGIIKGAKDGDLMARKTLSREELVAIINRLYRSEDYINKLENSNVDDKILTRYEKFIPPKTPSFKDVPKSHWAYKDIEFAKAEGITKGISNDKFGLGQSLNANQAALFLLRLLGYKEKIFDQKIEYKNAYYTAYQMIGIHGDNVIYENDALMRTDAFQMIYNAIIGIDKRGKQYLFSTYSEYDTNSAYVSDLLENNLSPVPDYIDKKVQEKGIKPMPNYNTSGYLEESLNTLKTNDFTKKLALPDHDTIKEYLYSVYHQKPRISKFYTNAYAISKVIYNHNLFIGFLDKLRSEKMEEINIEEIKKNKLVLFDDFINMENFKFSPFKKKDDNREIKGDYSAFHLLFDKREIYNEYYDVNEKGKKEINKMKLEIKKIFSNKSRNKFLITIRVADDEFQKIDVFFAFEIDKSRKKIINAFSNTPSGFALLKK